MNVIHLRPLPSTWNENEGDAVNRRLTRREFLTAGAAALLAPSLPGCGGGQGVDPAPIRIRLTARPGIPALAPGVGESALELGGGRDGILYVPATYAPESPAPLFIALHGAGGRGSDWSGFYTAAENRGMILLAPDSRGITWDLVRGSFGPDVEFLDRALAHTFERCRVDPDRIALAGFSDGASYALSLGVSNGDLLTHLVAFSPGFFFESAPLIERPRVFISHGTDDPVLSITNTRDRIVPALRSVGYEVTFLEFAGGHGVPAEVGSAALDWFAG
jgi:phospholipase/carboxylesterase